MVSRILHYDKYFLFLDAAFFVSRCNNSYTKVMNSTVLLKENYVKGMMEYGNKYTV